MANLQERLDEFKNSFESGAPPHNARHEAIGKMHIQAGPRSAESLRALEHLDTETASHHSLVMLRV